MQRITCRYENIYQGGPVTNTRRSKYAYVPCLIKRERHQMFKLRLSHTKNSDSHKPQRQYVPDQEQKDPKQLNLDIYWKLRAMRLNFRINFFNDHDVESFNL